MTRGISTAQSVPMTVLVFQPDLAPGDHIEEVATSEDFAD
jgi:hypothetical protein